MATSGATQPTSPAGLTSPTRASDSQSAIRKLASARDDARKTAAKLLAVHKPTSGYIDLRKRKMRLLKLGLRRQGNKNGVVLVK